MLMKCFSLLIIAIIGLVILMSGHGIASSSERETALFSQGYEYVFSYSPDKAAETFRIFLKEFPESSARDAAMFWLGKTLISMKLYGEAELTLQAIQKEFPDSPFKVFIAIEMEEIAKIRSGGSATKANEMSDSQKTIAPEETKDEAGRRKTDRNLTQILADNEITESLLEAERRTNRERLISIADLESREALLKKRTAELEVRVRKLADTEKSLKESRDERDRLSRLIAGLFAEKNTSEKDSGKTVDLLTLAEQPVVESGESLRFRLAQSELLAEEQRKLLAEAMEEQKKLKKLSQDEKKFAADLRAELTLSKERGNFDKAPSPGKESEKLIGEVNAFRGQLSELRTENTNLTNKIRELEHQAEQRILDIEILLTYLADLMLQKEEAPQQRPDMKTAEEIDNLKTALEEEKKRAADFRSQLIEHRKTQDRPQIMQDMSSAMRLAPEALIRIRDRDYPLTQIIDQQIAASLVFKRFGIKDIVWRAGNTLDDFISEELLFLEAKRTTITIDTKKLKEIIESHKLSTAEAFYLEKFMLISRYIDSQYADSPTDIWIELITVDYKPGDVASKTVLATELQEAAREGQSFEEIGKMHPEGVKFSRLGIQEFSSKYKEKSQIIQKLNLLKEETVVIWSDNGYMLIKPVSDPIAFNPFEELPIEKKEKLKAFLKQWLAAHSR